MNEGQAGMFRLTFREEVSSTNDVVKAAIENGEPEGFAVLAHRQTKGYGRQGRTWASPPGGMYLSLLLRPQVDPAMLPTLSLATSLAVRNALASIVSPDQVTNVLIKWPNDIVVPVPGEAGAARAFAEKVASLGSGATTPSEVRMEAASVRSRYRKLCGISLEAHQGAVCIGVGVNVFDPQVSEPLQGANSPVHLEELGFSGSLDEVARAFLDAMDPLYCTWMKEGFPVLLPEYRRQSFLMGLPVRMADQANNLMAQGEVVDVDERGCLVLRDEQGICTKLSSGEAHLL